MEYAAAADVVRLPIHVDRTRAVGPPERSGRHEADLPETDPTGV